LGREIPPREARLKRLAERIEKLKERDENSIRYAEHIAGLRSDAAAKLHGLLAGLVENVNRLLTGCAVDLDPPRFTAGLLKDAASCLFQINIRGRILQIQFAPTPELVSSEEFRIPYTLSGSVRAFNQQMLDKDLIEEQLIFYTVEKDDHGWRFFDGRTYRSGQLDLDYLISLIEQLL
jgi:hypothetical protein